MQRSPRRLLVTSFFLALVGFLLLCGIAILGIALWYTQPWLPYTEPDIQHALEVHYATQNPRLGGFWDSNGDCRVAIVHFEDGYTVYAEMQKEAGVWQVVSQNSGGLVPAIYCPR